jgi:uncharacterized Zn-binding protein involved in type VI secretion
LFNPKGDWRMTNSNADKKAFLFATIGSLTSRGGRVTTATGGSSVNGLDMARVGDVATYPDGSEAVIMDGVGSALVIDGQAAALVGSILSNGDWITETLQQTCGIAVPVGETIEGLLSADCVPSPYSGPTYRFAVKGATTRLGGVLREATSDLAVSGTHHNAACVGDYIEYGNGRRSQIVTGVGSPETPNFRALAIVGSLLENGDVITDSPDRRHHAVAFAPVSSDISIH